MRDAGTVTHYLLILCVVLLGLCAIVVACQTPPGQAAQGPGTGQWYYATGPHGEKCLFYTDGGGQTQTMAMDCDTVNP